MRGYTLIELLITISITTVLITFGMNAYRKSSDLQAVKSQTELILITLTAAQKAATTGKTDCTSKYLGEQIQFVASSSTITTTSICSTDQGISRTTTLTDMTFTQNVTLLFKPLNHGIDLGGVTTLNLDYENSHNDIYRIEISQSGTIRSAGKQ